MVLSNFSLFAISNVGAGKMIPSDITYFQELWKEADQFAKGNTGVWEANFILLKYYNTKMYKNFKENYFDLCVRFKINK